MNCCTSEAWNDTTDSRLGLIMMIEETLAKIMYMAHQVHKRHKIYPCKWTCLATLLLLDLDCIRRCDSRLGECRPVYTESTVHVVWGVGEKKKANSD